ncbi:acyclic terpene utilization AtuA family protein [Variovorax sp. EBFNA2]|uniref:acyclic terpene utilization AtuA family protein n=1 Tax=Variovorax sp. EBFNA2 TaxID=3342097 RepID=UPI0029C03AB4|nr:acyclic terpene utilization AtuA family protein [Variovorax boronicumulans]WPG41194.1 acyclic terpene utilization AtuA family protein [Variovorax boronicumulans]
MALQGNVKVMVPCGSLGSGVRESEIEYGLAKGANVIATDAGSTDSGAAYLALGKSKNNRGAVKRDLGILLRAHAKTGIPIIVGTAGQAGGDLNVDWTRDILLELVQELDISPKIALLYSEQEKGSLKAFNRQGKVRPLPPLGPLEDSAIDACEHIVGLMGVEPFIAALEAGADIVIGGRSTDTAVLASYPIWKGASWGASWHAGKIAECGAQCCLNPADGSGVLLTIDDSGFEVEPLSTTNRCTPHSVSKHMLYENSDPHYLHEPGGILDVTGAVYAQRGERTVRVEGANWVKQPYTMKLEGAAAGNYQTLMLIGIQDPDVLNNVNAFHDRLLEALHERTRKSIPAEELGEFHISLRMYGWNAVTGDVPVNVPPPREIGVLLVATARTQELANAIAHACNPYFFHYPMVMNKELPSYGFAFSPADVPRGQVFEFKLNHVVAIEDPLSLVRTVWLDRGGKAIAA